LVFGRSFQNELIAQSVQLLDSRMDDLEISFGLFAGIGNLSRKHTDRIWGPRNLLFIGYWRLFSPELKWLGHAT